jgi:hypothetical protein
MVNAENARDAKAETEWDDLAKGPEEEAAEPAKDAEYYRNHLNEVSELAAKYIQTHGGVGAVKNATWNEGLRMKVDYNGLPVHWSELSRYLRKNPDEIDRVFDACEFADKVSEASVEEDEPTVGEDDVETKDELAEEVEPAESENEPEEEPVEEESVEEDGDWTADALDIDGFDGMDSSKKLDKIDENVGGILSFQRLSSAWDKMAKALEGCSESVKAKVKLLRARETFERDQKFLKERQDRLKAISPIMPWSKNADEAKTLKDVIESSKRSLSYQESQLSLMETMASGGDMSEEDSKLVDKFRALDAKMDRLNADLHIREHTRDIKMRERWIADQKKFMDDDIANGGKDEASYAKRRDQIATWEGEIAGYKKRIEDYQKANPDFVLNPSAAKPAGAEQKKAA